MTNKTARLTHPKLLALLLCLAVEAASAAPTLPGAGTLLQEIRPQAPALPGNDPGLARPAPPPTGLPDSDRFLVNTITIAGNTAFDTGVLHELVKDAEGTEITLPTLGTLADRITDFYRRHGHPLARAIVPAQTIEGGLVTLQVIEARYGQIVLNNQSRVSDRLLAATLAPLRNGDLVTDAALDEALLLLQDIPGVTAQPRLKAGAEPGTTDLLVDTARSARFTGNVSFDNAGNVYAGRERFIGTASVLAPFHLGDTLSVTLLGGPEDLTRYGTVEYEALLDGHGLRAGVSFEALDYALGDTLAKLGARGDVQTGTAWLKRPLVRSQSHNLYAQLEAEYVSLDDEIAANQTRTARHLAGATASIFGDLRFTRWLRGGLSWRLGVNAGELTFDNRAAAALDAQTARTAGTFTRFNASASVLQALTEQDTLYLLLSGQAATGNLDSSRKQVVGGPYSVRAYNSSTLSGDDGVQVTLEWRRALALPLPGSWQGFGFIDSATLIVNEDQWTSGPNTATLSGGGAGLRWSGPAQWRAEASVAAPFGDRPAQLSSADDVRAWVQLSKSF